MTIAEAISAEYAGWGTPGVPFVEPMVFGTGDPAAIAAEVEAFCRRNLGADVAECVFYRVSIASVFGLRLTDGRQVVLHGYRPARSEAFLAAMVRVQHALVDAGFPCPKAIIGPLPLGRSHGTVEELMQPENEDLFVDPHRVDIAAEMAHTLARLVGIASDVEGVSALLPPRLADGLPYPRPHHELLFDFVGTTSGAEWIDDMAWRALEIINGPVGPHVVGHSDWRIGQMRFRAGRIVAVYDWESLRWQPEAAAVGDAMRSFTNAWPPAGRLFPYPDQMDSFVRRYQFARGRALAANEWRLARATAVHSLAYGARVEHARNPDDRRWALSSARWTLKVFGDQLLRS